jgi:hypothetical protein
VRGPNGGTVDQRSVSLESNGAGATTLLDCGSAKRLVLDLYHLLNRPHHLERETFRGSQLICNNINFNIISLLIEFDVFFQPDWRRLPEVCCVLTKEQSCTLIS